MNLFNILPGFQTTPAGLERVVLRRLPRVLWVGTALPAALSVLARWLPWTGSEAEVLTRITTLDIYAISLVVLHWTLVLTVAIGAFIVMVMKGPAYVADAYPLVEYEHPQASSDRSQAGSQASTRQAP
jgi:hypothetical protein